MSLPQTLRIFNLFILLYFTFRMFRFELSKLYGLCIFVRWNWTCYTPQ